MWRASWVLAARQGRELVLVGVFRLLGYGRYRQR